MFAELEQYRKMVNFLAETMGSTFEVGLFDMTDPAVPVVAAANANSDAQEKVRDLIVGSMDSQLVQTGHYFANYPVTLDFDKLLKVSVFFIRDATGNIIGALWLGMRCDLFLKMESFALSMLQFCTEDPNERRVEPAKASAAPRELTLDTITEVIHNFGAAPARMTLAERQEVICDLYDMGVYNLRGAVARTAEVMQISEQSVYRYIAKLKKARDW